MGNNLKYARIDTFYYLLRPYQMRTRALRAKVFLDLMSLRPGMKVIDLGGSPQIWQWIKIPLNITLVNLTYDHGTSPTSEDANHHTFTHVIGDACETRFASNSFDMTFSNSVIEHVGGVDKQRAFAREVRRLAPSYWVQTPSKWFPIEAHSGMPFWFFYPPSLRESYIDTWRPKLPAWTEMIEGTTLIERSSLKDYFADAKFITERSFGIVKSNIAYRNGR